jgi:hypothetical protein
VIEVQEKVNVSPRSDRFVIVSSLVVNGCVENLCLELLDEESFRLKVRIGATDRKPFRSKKTPVQERSAAGVDAILKATVEILLRVGRS